MSMSDKGLQEPNEFLDRQTGGCEDALQSLRGQGLMTVHRDCCPGPEPFPFETVQIDVASGLVENGKPCPLKRTNGIFA